MSQAHWFSLSKTPFLARSSHSIAASKSGILIVYGGELRPNVPIDSGTKLDATPKGSLHIFDLAKSLLSQGWRMLTPDTKNITGDAASAIPEPRVGATTVWDGDALYLWGGRGADNALLDEHQAGVWKATINLGQGTRQSVRWERISAVNEDEAPSPRSYHTAVAHGDHIYVHAGFPESGELSALHSFNIKNLTWNSLSPAPEPGRGGTALVSATLAGENNVLLRYGGFSDRELPATGEVDIYIISEDKWVTVQPNADPSHEIPGPRSVHGFAPYRSPLPELANAVAVVYHGEREPPIQGSNSAGTFWDDVWLLSKEPTDDILSGWAWRRLDVVGDDHLPEGRGFFPPVSWADSHGDTKVVMFGGLLEDHTRSDELWELEIN